ncbi:MAG: VWA domain-containing protein [Spirochaetes bacterium]|nr:MAG: VWA domain-containing protein [Spirochaetota bacterium]
MKKTLLLGTALITLVLAAAPLTPQNRMIVAILDFTNSTGDSANNYLQAAIPEMFSTNLAQNPAITVLERDRVEKLLKEKGLIMSGLAEGDESKIGKILAAEQLLTGSIIKAGTVLRIDVRLVEVATGKIIASEKHQCASVNEIIDSVDVLSETVLARLTGKPARIVRDIEPAVISVTGDSLVSMELLQENPYYLARSNKPYHFRTGFIAKELKMKKERVPLNICVVLDRSGSMDEQGKLDYAKQSIAFVIKNLAKSDIFSLVTYDDAVEVYIPPTAVTDKNALSEKVSKIETGGSTNLSGGMLEGYEQVKKNFKANQVNRVLLISDGLANVGVTEPDQIQQIARGQSKSGISISTFGVGQSFNEILMTGIAEYGNANYYYIDKPDKIADIFSRELKGLLAVVAQNCTLTIGFPEGGTIEGVSGYKYETTPGGIAIKLGDLVSEEKKLALIRIIPGAAQGARAVAARVTYTYDDVVTGRGRVTESRDAVITPTADQELISKNYIPTVLKDVDMFASTDLMQKTMEMVDSGRLDDAKKNLDTNLALMRGSLKKYQSRELKRQVLNIMEYKESLDQLSKSAAPGYKMEESDDYQRMQKSGRSSQYELMKKK